MSKAIIHSALLVLVLVLVADNVVFVPCPDQHNSPVSSAYAKSQSTTQQQSTYHDIRYISSTPHTIYWNVDRTSAQTINSVASGKGFHWYMWRSTWDPRCCWHSRGPIALVVLPAMTGSIRYQKAPKDAGALPFEASCSDLHSGKPGSGNFVPFTGDF